MTPHPLDPLSAAEIAQVRAVLVAEGRVGEHTRFPSVLPVEPPRRGTAPRRALAVLLDTATGAAAEAVVDLAAGAVESVRDLDPARDGQPPILFAEYDRCADLVRADPRWQAAMRRRGVTEFDLVFLAPLSPGHFGRPAEHGRRILRTLTFLRDHVDDSPWAHPVEGLIAEVDLITGEVLDVRDDGDTPIPAEHGNYRSHDPFRPISITQPEGVSFTVDGHEITWGEWRLRVGFSAREGLTLHRVEFGGDPVLHRAAIAEMVVPYGDPSPYRHWISYFDAGEYLLGKNANSLRLGCDCLGVIHYLDAVVADDHCRPVTIPQAICLHEEDHGVLWKHTNILTGAADTLRSRRLVVSFFSTIGNYDYGFFWYFYPDGTIELEAKATGVVFAAAGEETPYAAPIAPGLTAPVHQHLFCARLDMDVAGGGNTVTEVDLVGVPAGPDNPYGNAFTTRSTVLDRESRAARLADPARGRTWLVTGTETNRLGKPRAYQLVPRPGPTLLAQPEATVTARAAFATRHLWVTRYDPAERYPAGDYPNQHPGGAGLPEWTAQDRDLVETDLVLWHVFGPTHVPRPEDWPVMPVDHSGFHLRPVGFRDRNPAADFGISTDRPAPGTGVGCPNHPTPGQSPGNP
ncbi:primary-amine oxidase [Actinokineospora sp. UTMC 2448]|uniref:primary-amine oxidase n=1 Tax=Actinokineospora sp. UTMC 2448 TaxID=2268449 RepID=UPI002164B472|nr:primary-amine oxidase [Actinokineospora sp. UTMC 2448]UVS80047.1 Histamine oxidase [Actinokineospora sp. UTMC 2448]